MRYDCRPKEREANYSKHGRPCNDWCRTLSLDIDLRLVVDGHEVLQTSGMVAMAMGDKHIVNGAEVDSQ